MKKYLTFLVALLLIMTACSNNNNDSNYEGTPFIGGDNGIILSFGQGAPPENVYDGGDFQFGINVQMENEGEYTIEEGKANVKISGILSSDFNNVDLFHTTEEDLIKTSKDPDGNVLKGTTYHAEFNDLDYTSSLEGSQQFTIRADVCYDYGTTTTTKLCFREDLLDSTKEGVCDVNGAKTVHNSGAPVQITSLEESATGSNKIAFTFNIEKKGNGNIFKSKFIGGGEIPDEQCKSVRKFEDKVWVDVDFDGNSDLNGATTCQGLKDSGNGNDPDRQGFVTLYSGEKSVRCTVNLEDDSVKGDYEKIITIKLRYDYQEHINTNILVKHASNE